MTHLVFWYSDSNLSIKFCPKHLIQWVEGFGKTRVPSCKYEKLTKATRKVRGAEERTYF